MRIALFGGSFDPPHVGHLLSVAYVLATEPEPIDELWMVPVFEHPFHKRLEGSFEHRVRLCQVALDSLGLPRAKVSTVEAELKGEGRTVDLLEHLHATRPADQWALVLGSDLVAEKHTWKCFDRIEELAHIIEIERQGHHLGHGPALLPEVSSTEVRALLAEGGDASKLVPRAGLLISEIYTFLKQADARELRHIFVELDEARRKGADTADIQRRIDNYETHVVPIIADIDAGFGNEEATYLLARKMIEAGACAIQIENQVSDAKQCGHQAGKVTVPHEDFVSKINAVRYAFLELGVDNGIIVARTDSLGADLTQKIPVSKRAGDLGSKYNDFLKTTPVHDINELKDGDITIHQNGVLCKPERLDNGLYAFKENTGVDRVVLDCVTSLEHGADLLWIETEKPNVAQIAAMVTEIRKARPDAKLVYNN